MADMSRPPEPAKEPATSEEPETERGGSPATHSSSRINEEDEASGEHPPPDEPQNPGANARPSP